MGPATAAKPKTVKPRKLRGAGIEIEGKFHAWPEGFTLDESATLCDIAGVEDMIEFEFLNVANPRAVKAIVWLIFQRRGDEDAYEKAGQMPWSKLRYIPAEKPEGEGGDKQGPPAESGAGSTAPEASASS